MLLCSHLDDQKCMDGVRNTQGREDTMKNYAQVVCKEQSFPYHDPHSELSCLILEVIERERGYDLEKLLHALRGYTWNQVFLEVDRMSRTGELQLCSRGPGLYTVCLPLPTTRLIVEEQSMVSA
jgi:hypothetical protein